MSEIPETGLLDSCMVRGVACLFFSALEMCVQVFNSSDSLQLSNHTGFFPIPPLERTQNSLQQFVQFLTPQLSLGYILPLKCICALKSSSIHAAGQD